MERRGKKPGKEVDCCCGCHALAVVMWYAREIIFNRKGLGDILWISREFGRCQRMKLRDKLLMGRCYTVQRWKKKLQQSLQKVEPDSTCSNLSLFWPLQACSAYAVSSIYVWREFFGSPIQYGMKGLCVGYIRCTAVLLLFQTGVGWSQTRRPIEP